MQPLIHSTRLRVRYADTDQMGVVYYAKYLEYFEVARTEALRAIGLPYAELERIGFMLPVAEATVTYYKGARYDDELLVTAVLKPTHSPRVHITYEVTFAQTGEIAAKGETTLVFVNAVTGKPVRPPKEYFDALNARG